MFEGREDMDELLAAYTLDAVGPDEATIVERYLETSEEARRELDELRAVAAQLVEDGDEPPAGVWERLSAAIAEGTSAEVDTSLAERRTSRQRSGRRWAWVAAAAVVLAAVGIAFGASQYRKAEDREDQLAAGAEGRFDELAADPDAVRFEMVSPEDGATVAVALVADGEAVVDLSDLSAPEGGDIQLWGLGGDQPISLGVTSGGGFVTAAVPDEPYPTLALSVEPAGGSPAPTEVVAVS